MNKIENTLTRINDFAEDDYSRFLQSANRHYAAALAESLPQEERERLLQGTSLKGYLEKRREMKDRRILAKAKGVLRPIKDVIADFSDGRSGKRMEARKELQWRFVTQAGKDQIAILTAMLQAGTKIDTAWVAQTLAGGYDKTLQEIQKRYPKSLNCFRELLYQRCEENISCPSVAAYMVDNMPIELIEKHLEELESIGGYRKLCLRMASNRAYIIDESKMTLFQYLDVLARTGRTTEQQPIWRRFCDWLQEASVYSVSWYNHMRFEQTNGDTSINLSLADIREVSWFIKSCGTLEFTDLICAVFDLDQRVQARLHKVLELDDANHQVPYDISNADEHYKSLLIQFAKEEISNIETSSLPKNLTE